MTIRILTPSYFAQFPDYKQCEVHTLVDRFEGLSIHRGWKIGGKRYRKEKRQCLVQEFAHSFNSPRGSLAGWQELCEFVDIEPSTSITKCKKALAKVNVNLVDLIDAKCLGIVPQTFKTRRQLANYSREEDKVCPRAAAKQDAYLKVFLKRML